MEIFIENSETCIRHPNFNYIIRRSKLIEAITSYLDDTHPNEIADFKYTSYSLIRSFIYNETRSYTLREIQSIIEYYDYCRSFKASKENLIVSCLALLAMKGEYHLKIIRDILGYKTIYQRQIVNDLISNFVVNVLSFSCIGSEEELFKERVTMYFMLGIDLSIPRVLIKLGYEFTRLTSRCTIENASVIIINRYRYILNYIFDKGFVIEDFENSLETLCIHPKSSISRCGKCDSCSIVLHIKKIHLEYLTSLTLFSILSRSIFLKTYK
jgi:hypothetical protein